MPFVGSNHSVDVSVTPVYKIFEEGKGMRMPQYLNKGKSEFP